MANNEMIDIVSPGTHASIQRLIAELREVATEVTNINNNLRNTRLPSDNRSNLNQINAQQQQLNTTRQRANQLSAEEIVNQRTLRQNAELHARSVSVLGGAYQRLSAQQAIASRNLQNIIARGRTADQTQRQYNTELRNAQNQFDRLNQRVLSADRAVGRFNRNVGNYPTQAIRGIKDLIGAFGVVGGITAVAMVTQDIFKQTKELQSLELALKQVLGTSEDLGATQTFLARVADDYGVGIKELTRSYTQFYVSAKDKLSGNEIQGIFESISKAAGSMGLSVEQQEGAFLAISQMLSKGNVSAEELRGQLGERLPGAFGIMAKSMGVTEQELNKLLKDGKVLANEVLPKFAKELEKAYGIENLQRVESLNAETTRLSNTWTEFISEISGGNSVVSNFFAGFIGLLGKSLEGLTYIMQSEEKREDVFRNSRINEWYKASIDLYKEMGKEADKQAQIDLESYDEKIKNLNLEVQAIEERNKALQETVDQSKILGFLPIGTEDERINIRKNALEITNLKNQIAGYTGSLNAAKEQLDKTNQSRKTEAALTKEQIDKQKRLLEERLKNEYLLKKATAELELYVLKQQAEDEDIYYTARLTALEEARKKEIEIIALTYNEEMRLAKGNQTLQLIALRKYQLDSRKLMEANKEKVEELNKLKINPRGLADIDTGVDAYLKEQGENAIKSLEAQKEAADKLKQAYADLRDMMSQYLSRFTESFFGDNGFPTLFKALNNDIVGFGTDASVTLVAVAEIAQETLNFMNQSQQAYYDAQYSRLEREKDIAIEFAGESTTAREEIERQYEERRKEIRRQEAEAQRQSAIFNAVINTAQAVVGALAKLPDPSAVPLSIAVGIIGAAQIATIASQPIPEYRMGTDFHKGGPAIVGDGGKHEVVYQPSSGFSVTPKTDTLVDLERGAKVYPDMNSFLKNSGAMLGGIPNIELESSGISKNEMEYLMSKYIKPDNSQIQVSKTGVSEFIGTSIAKQKLLNDRMSFKVKKV